MSYTTMVVFAAAPFAARRMFALLFGPAKAEQMVLPCTLLAVGFYMSSTLNLPYMLSLADGKPGIALSLNAWAVAVVLPVTVLLVWRWGLNGAALSWSFTMCSRICTQSRESAGSAPPETRGSGTSTC